MKKVLKITFGLIGIALTIFILISIFFLADLRTSDIKNDTQSEEQIQFAKNLLNEVIKKQGMDKINQFTTYEIVATDDWKGFMGKMVTSWDWNNDEMSMRFSVGDFDGQVEVLQGEKKGFIAGIQSWDYYEKVGDTYQSNVEDDGGKVFNLSAYHFLFELANRLSNAPFIRYAGEGELNGKPMEKVFVSWGNSATKQYDQYILWIGKTSGLIEAATFTIRDNPSPLPAFIYGTMHFDDYRNINGIMIPFKKTVQMMNPKNNMNNYLHQLTVQKFEWDNFPISDIRPFSDIEPVGDDKAKN